MDRNVRILYFGNAAMDVASLRADMQNSGISALVQSIDNQADFAAALSAFSPQAIVYSYPASSISLHYTLDVLHRSGSGIPVILLAEPAGEAFALSMLKAGLTDYVLTDRKLRLPHAIMNAIQKAASDAENAAHGASKASQTPTMNLSVTFAKTGNITIDIASGAQDWSPGAELIFGVEPGAGEASCLNFYDLVHPEDKERITRETGDGIANLNEFALEFRIFTPAGRLKHVVSGMVVSRDELRVAKTARCFIQDITEREKAEATLKSAYDELMLLFNTIEDTFYSRDMISGELIQISPACEKLYGYTSEEFMADPGLKKLLVHPDFSDMPAQSLERLEKGETIKAQFQIIHKSGLIKWVESNVVPGFDDKGRLARIDAVTRDITEKKYAEKQLQDNEQRFRCLFENIADVVTVVDADRNFIFANDNLTKVLGYTLEEYKLARYRPDFVHPDYKPEEELLYLHSSQTPGESFPFDLQFKHKNGHWVWLEGTVKNLLHVQGLAGIVSTYRDVTEQKNAELLLKHSEQRFRGLVENSLDMVTIADIDGNIIFSSDNVTKILGYSQSEYAQVRFEKDFVHPKDRQRLQLLFAEVRKNPGRVYAISWEIKHKHGDWVWLEGTVCNLLHVQAVKGVVANFRDISQQRKDHRALQNSRANLSAIIENTTDLVYSLDKSLNFITFNEIFKNTIKQVYGFEVTQGGSALMLTESLAPDVAAKWREHYRQALEGKPLRFVNEYPVPDGGKVYLSYSINPIHENNKVIGLSVFSRDITKEKLDEIAMQQSEANMRSVFENTDVAINLFDIDLKLISYNSISDKHAMLFFGKDLKIGASAYDYFPKERWPTINQVIKRVKAHETVVYEIFYPRRDGEREWMEVKWFGVADQQHNITGIILIYRNITENKNAEIEREKITNDLMRRNEDLEQFTYIISHNLRAPVANIKGLSDLLLIDSPESNDTLKALSSSVGQLDNVIIDLNHILQVGKQVNDRKEKIMLVALFQEISLELNSIIAQNKVHLQYDFIEVNHIVTIKGYLYSIFQNLVVNSIKYRRYDTEPIIHITANKDGDNIVFTYTDNGKGIDLERYGQQLFGLYKRFDFSVEGKGVGLFMVKMQVQSLGGSIGVQSQLGKGVTFTVTLPA